MHVELTPDALAAIFARSPQARDLAHERAVATWLSAMTPRELAAHVGLIQGVLSAKDWPGVVNAGRLQTLLEARANG